MAPSKICYMVLPLFILSSAQHLTIHPGNTMVPLGGRVHLNCSINCPSGSTNWIGLDTALNGQHTGPGYSTLLIENASISMDGLRICVGDCPDQHKVFQDRVTLYVYALPDTLLLNTSIRHGTPYLHCLMKGIYPMYDVSVKCYRGSEELDEPTETIEEEDGDLTTVIWSWEVPMEDWKSQSSYSCEAKVVVGEGVEEQAFTRVGTLTVPNTVVSTDTVTTLLTPQKRDITPTTLESFYGKPSTAASNGEAETLHVIQESTTMVNERSTFADHLNTDGTTNSVFPATEQRESITASFTSQLTDGVSSNQMTPHVKTTTAASTVDPPSVYVTQESTTVGRESTSTSYQVTDPTKPYYNTNMTAAENQETTMNTRIPEIAPTRTDSTTFQAETTQNTLVFSSISSVSGKLTTYRVVLPVSTEVPVKDVPIVNFHLYGSRSENQRILAENINLAPNLYKAAPEWKDEKHIMWMMAPAAGLAGSILIALWIWRQLNKKGFFQPQQTDCSGCKKGGKAKDLHSLESGLSPYIPAR